MPRCIAYLASTLPTRSETFVYRELRELRRRGWTVRAISLHPPGEASDGDRFDDLTDGLTVIYDGAWMRRSLAELLCHPLQSLATILTSIGDAILPGEPAPMNIRMKWPVQAVAGLAAARSLRADRPASIHCHFAHAPTTVGMYAAQQLRIPFSFTGHANDLFQRRALLKRKLQRAGFVACISRWHRDFYREAWRGAADKSVVIRCGVDHTQWKPAAASSPTPPSPASSPLRLLTVCRLMPKKGVDTLIGALARLNRPAELTVAGDGPQRETLQSLARELNCHERIRWLGAVDNERVRELMSRADVFVLPCRTDASGDRDGIPVVLIEAMAGGLAAISGDLPAIRELIDHGRDGLLVEGDNPQQLADTLESLTPDRCRELGRTARMKIETEFSLSLNVTRLEEALSRL